MNYLRLLFAYFRIGIMIETAYRINFFIQLFHSLVNLGMAIAGLSIVFSYTDTLGGWRQEEILALVGIYIFVVGSIELFIQPGMQVFIESVRDGSLDFVLTKPEDAQLLVSIGRFTLWSILDIALGLGILVFTMVRLGQTVTWREAAAFILMLTSGGLIVYSFLLILATLSFWFVKVENLLTIFQSMYEAGRWPVSLYPGWLRYGLTFIVPVAFATTVPAEAITGRLTFATLLLALSAAAVLLVVSRLFWRFGLRHYSGASA